MNVPCSRIGRSHGVVDHSACRLPDIWPNSVSFDIGDGGVIRHSEFTVLDSNWLTVLRDRICHLRNRTIGNRRQSIQKRLLPEFTCTNNFLICVGEKGRRVQECIQVHYIHLQKTAGPERQCFQRPEILLHGKALTLSNLPNFGPFLHPSSVDTTPESEKARKN